MLTLLKIKFTTDTQRQTTSRYQLQQMAIKALRNLNYVQSMQVAQIYPTLPLTPICNHRYSILDYKPKLQNLNDTFCSYVNKPFYKD